MRRLVLLIASVSLFASCLRDDQVRYKNRMEGTWQIDEVISYIKADGSVSNTTSTPSVGTLLLEPSEFEDGVFLDYTLTLNNSSFSWYKKPFKTDEARKRVFFYYFYCDNQFGCDMVATLEQDQRNQQQWSFFKREEQNNELVHRKVTWTLKRL